MLNGSFISLVLFFLLLSTFASNYLAFASDAQALLLFKSNADIHNLLPFNTSFSHCSWPGVQCDSADKVVRFVVQDVPLAGFFYADSLTRLDQLRVLSLQNNSLSGLIPDLTSLVNLKSFFLTHNNFSGYFPPSISSLHRLRTLDLSYNNLTGPIPAWLTRLDRLGSLRLDFNRFNGSIPPLNQSSLSTFNVTGNNLSGPVPATPVLETFGPSSFALNPSLCGDVLNRECFLKLPFLGPSSAMEPPAAGIGQNADLRGAELAHTNTKKHRHNKIMILGFSIGFFLLILTLFCVAIAMKKQRIKEKNRGEFEGGSEVAEAVAEVMRTEEEREEKVKTVEEGIKAAKSGTLMFFAGEAQSQPYTADKLMKASAELLGRGTVGTTYKAVLDDESSLVVCVKRLDGSKVVSAGKEEFIRHMGTVGGLRHPNLVPLRAYFQERGERLLVYDYQPNGSIFSLIHGSESTRAKPLHWTSCLKIAEDVAQGLSYIHQVWKFAHGNIKSSNVLLGSDFEARLTDYCLAELTLNNDEPDPASSGYKAPEILGSIHEATPKTDVYAFGVLLLELLTGKPPGQHPYLAAKDMVRWMMKTRDEGEEEGSRVGMLLQVGMACRVKSADERPTMCQVLKMLQEIKESFLLEESDFADHSHHHSSL